MAGALDDPDGEQSPEVAATETNRRVRPRARGVIGLGVVLVIGVAGLTLWPSRHDRPGGDPGGRLLTALRPVAAAVPAGATGIAIESSDAVWSPACPDNPGGRAGWSAVRVTARFTDVAPGPRVVDAIGAALGAEGWSRHDASFGPSQGTVARWTKRLDASTMAEATAYPIPVGTTRWNLTATAKPPGFALPGC